MENKRISFWHKFFVGIWRCDGGWALRIFFGFGVVVFFWNYFHEWSVGDRLNGVGLAYVPWNVCEGGLMPYRQWVHRSSLKQV